jgi:hypothetical protein
MSEPALPGDEGAALQWAVENFRNNVPKLKDPDSAKERLAYNKQLLIRMSCCVETIQRGNTLSIVVPESPEQLHRMDHDELVDLIAAARKGGGAHELLLAVAAALIDNDYSLPSPLKEFVIEFLRNPEVPQRGRGRKREYERDDVIAWAVATICIRWEFSPTRNEATSGPSAISIVKRALEKIGIHLTEAAITKIWDKSGPRKELVARHKERIARLASEKNMDD